MIILMQHISLTMPQGIASQQTMLRRRVHIVIAVAVLIHHTMAMAGIGLVPRTAMTPAMRGT